MITTAPPKSTRRERWAWYLYDFGNSAYAAIILLAVFSVYFKNKVVNNAEEGTRLWGLAVLIAMLVVAVISPVLGTLADFSAAKKRFLLFFTGLTCVFTAALFFAEGGNIALAMTCFIVAEIGYRSAQVFYDALLPEIAAPEEMGRISGIGWAIGSVGGIAALLTVLPLILFVKVEGTIIVRLSFVVTALMFAIAAAPIFFWLPERAKPQPLPAGETYLGIAFGRLRQTIRTAAGFKEFLKFILAFIVFNDGVMMALDFAAIIGNVLFGVSDEGLIIFIIIVHVTNIAGAYLFGYLVDRTGGKPSLTGSILLMVAAVMGLYFNQGQTGFFILGGLAGFAMAGIQSVSRTMVAMFAPPGKSAEFYGFFSVAGRTSSFIGPGVYGWLAAEAAIWYKAQGMAALAAEQTGQRIAILSIAVFLLAGMGLLWFVNEKKAREAARLGTQIAQMSAQINADQLK